MSAASLPEQLDFFPVPASAPSTRSPSPAAAVETYSSSNGEVERQVILRNGFAVRTPLVPPSAPIADGPVDREQADSLWLKSAVPPEWRTGETIRIVDLFAGCGGLSYGVAEAIRATGATPACVGIDMDGAAIAAYQRSLPGGRGLVSDVSTVFDGRAGQRATASERAMLDLAGNPTFLLGGPPCQGHSAFNNRTRHADKRNALYFTMVRAAEVLQPQHIVIENVPGALRDRNGVVQRSLDDLERLGYSVDHRIVDMSHLGVPQVRKRLIVVASLGPRPDLGALFANHSVGARTLRWAIGDLEDHAASGLLDEPCASAPQTRRRIDVLFEQDLYDLPDEYRPACHASGGHSYRSIYGRLRWDQPAQTVTTGFYSMCMGRNVHPSQRRTITAHEAARIQFIPDVFDFSVTHKRTELARLIGNAVPPKLGYVVGLELLR